jgi:Secretion system C-terminal sorting domain
MKKNIFFLILLFPFLAHAQTGYYCSIKYSYDANGNRAQRLYSCEQVTLGGLETYETGNPSAQKPIGNLVVSSVGITDSTGDFFSMVFPNPNQGVFKIKTTAALTNARVQMIDNLGKIIQEKTFNGTEESYDIRSFPLGSYYILLIPENKKSVAHKIEKR